MRVAFALVIFILGGATAASSAVLSGNDLKAKIVDKTCSWTAGKTSGTISFTADGVAKGTGQSGSLVGTWRIKGNRFCDKFKDRNKGKESCFTFDETSPGSYKGSTGFTATCS